jgi:hypothetical protein
MEQIFLENILVSCDIVSDTIAFGMYKICDISEAGSHLSSDVKGSAILLLMIEPPSLLD